MYYNNNNNVSTVQLLHSNAILLRWSATIALWLLPLALALILTVTRSASTHGDGATPYPECTRGRAKAQA